MKRWIVLVVAVVLAGCTSAAEPTTTTVTTVAAAPGSSTTVTTGADTATTPTTTSSTTSPTTMTTPSTTTTSTTSTTTTTTTTTSTTTTVPPSQPPVVTITSPANLTAFTADYSTDDGMFGADVTFTAEVSDPEGDSFTVEWFSSQEGYLGTGETIAARVHTIGSDSSQPFITARAIDSTGAVGEDTIQIIVWIPSDQG